MDPSPVAGCSSAHPTHTHLDQKDTSGSDLPSCRNSCPDGPEEGLAEEEVVASRAASVPIEVAVPAGVRRNRSSSAAEADCSWC